RPPWRNIDVRIDSQTDFRGKKGGVAASPPWQASGSIGGLNVSTTSSTVNGRPLTSSQGMAAFSSVKAVVSSMGIWPMGVSTGTYCGWPNESDGCQPK